VEKIDPAKVIRLFEELEFRSLLKQVGGLATGESASSAGIDTQKVEYILVNSRQALNEFISKLKKHLS